LQPLGLALYGSVPRLERTSQTGLPRVNGAVAEKPHPPWITLGGMAYVTKEARQELLDTVAEATDRIAAALAAIGAAYEQLDEASADRLEEQLFRPVQLTYGRARRTHNGFAERYDLPLRDFEPAVPGVPSTGVAGFLDDAIDAMQHADDILTELQDSLSPVEVGDAELRAGLADVRERLGELPERATVFMRTFGR
jgi:hypothetical protein